jgi:SAM-dependent methyltransferase
MTAVPMAPSPWKLGDFHVIGRTHNAGDALCEDCGLGAEARVLDVACGSGNTALSAARYGARVTGLDLVDKLIERARIRAEAEGFNIDFLTGTAEELPFPDGTFDYVLSTFGVMFAPNQERAASELLRVCKPGGTIGLSNWTLESFPGTLFGIGRKYGPPPPPGTRPPVEWGTVPGLRRLFDGQVKEMRLLDRSFRMDFANFEAWFDTFRNFFGPMKMLFDNLPQEQATVVREELREAVVRYNRATDATLSVAMSYVNVVMRRA